MRQNLNIGKLYVTIDEYLETSARIRLSLLFYDRSFGRDVKFNY